MNKDIDILESQLKFEKEKNALLQNELELQADQILRLRRYIGIQEVLQPFFKAFMTLSACNLLIDPNPVDLKCGGEKSGFQQIFPVRVIDILAIEGGAEYKKIYLRTKINPKEGGAAKSELIFREDGIDFEKLLLKIQRNGQHLLHVQKSWSINIYHYLFSEKNNFHLKENYKTEFNSNIHTVPVGSIFDKNLYQQRLFEINKLREQAGLSLQQFQRGEEIKQKLNDLGLLD